jgi:hypothetical protein
MNGIEDHRSTTTTIVDDGTEIEGDGDREEDAHRMDKADGQAMDMGSSWGGPDNDTSGDEDEKDADSTSSDGVEYLGTRTVRIGDEATNWTYGFLGMGYDLTQQVWPHVQQGFSFNGEGGGGGQMHPNRVSRARKEHCYADVWIVDQLEWESLEDWLEWAPSPHTIVWFQPPESLVHSTRCHSLRNARKNMKSNGYHTSYTQL